MPAMHACAHSTTLQVGPHLAATYSLEAAKAADVCSTLRIHNQCECRTSASTQYKMAHVKVEVPIRETMRFEAFSSACATTTQAGRKNRKRSISVVIQGPYPSTLLRKFKTQLRKYEGKGLTMIEPTRRPKYPLTKRYTDKKFCEK
jgi:hypothetical protein